MAQYSAYSDIKIGASVVGLGAVTDLQYGGVNAGCPPPTTRFQQFAKVRETADGNVRGLGKPTITWTFRHVPFAAINALRDLLTDPNMSGTIYIASPDKDGNIQNWACVAQWPLPPADYESFAHWDDLALTFKRCVQQ